MRLQPDKHDWTEKQRKYWFRGDTPILGILAKLVGNSVQGSSSMDKRLLIVVELATGKKLTKPGLTVWKA